jgi:hypothetical protein
MKHKNQTERPESSVDWEARGLAAQEAELCESLGNFKASVDAWSSAMMSRPRTAHEIVVRRTWRVAAGWALGCVVFAGSVSGGMFEHHRQQELARITAAQQAEQQRQLAAERAREEEDLLAKVDSDVSRQVPSAMEPLASLMAEDEK